MVSGGGGLRLLYYKVINREKSVLPAKQYDVIRTDQRVEHCASLLLIISSKTADASYKDGVEKQLHVCTGGPSDCHRQNALILSQGLFGTERWKIGQFVGT
jgi:hypothetical protein